MKLIKIDPPGSWCHYEAVMEMIRRIRGRGRTFMEVGCGAGDLSLRLCREGWKGIGVDSSSQSIERATETLAEYLATGKYRLIQRDIFALEDLGEKVDVGLSMMVMEHVEDHVGFLRKIASRVKPGGHLIIAVPGRRDRWGIEDETVGHLRRYDRLDLKETLKSAGLKDILVWSVAVPVANLLFHLGNHMVRNSSEIEKVRQSAHEQTASSGVREIPWKTVFPSWCRLILNRTTLFPLFVAQRCFYDSNLGLTMLAMGTVPDVEDSAGPGRRRGG